MQQRRLASSNWTWFKNDLESAQGFYRSWLLGSPFMDNRQNHDGRPKNLRAKLI